MMDGDQAVGSAAGGQRKHKRCALQVTQAGVDLGEVQEEVGPLFGG